MKVINKRKDNTSGMVGVAKRSSVSGKNKYYYWETNIYLDGKQIRFRFYKSKYGSYAKTMAEVTRKAYIITQTTAASFYSVMLGCYLRNLYKMYKRKNNYKSVMYLIETMEELHGELFKDVAQS